MKSLFRIILIGFSSYLLGCSGLDTSSENRVGLFTETIQKFSSCSDLRTKVNAATQMLSQVSSNFDGAVPVMAPVPESNTIYDTQSKNVLESDKVLINSRNLFVLRKSSLEVFNRATFQREHILSLAAANTSTMFVDENKITLIASNNYDTTTVTVIDARQLLVKKQYQVDGYFAEARIHNDQLILQTSSNANLDSSSEGALNTDPTILSPQCQNIYDSQVNAYGSTLTLLYNFSLKDLSKAPSMSGFAGYTNLMYMSENALYLASNSFYTFPSHLRQIVWDENSIQLKSVVTYPGSIKDRWAINEYNDQDGVKIALATTISKSGMNGATEATNFLPDTDRTNQLLVFSELDGKLKLTAESKLFGDNENIRSVRFLNDLAYVVTFRTTDPLFIFDLSNRNQIQQLGELKVPGFSTHLRPLSDSDLFGVGYDADAAGRQTGIQVSLFDVGVKQKPTRKNVFSIGVRGSYSDATIDAHALMFDKASGLVALPVVELINPNGNDPFAYGTTLGFAGAQVYKYSNGQLLNYGRLTHNKWRQNFACDTVLFNGWSHGSSDINRIVMIDGKLITVSQFGVMVHNPQTLSVISEQMFTPRSSGFCYEPGLIW